MRAVVQRVSQASVDVDKKCSGKVKKGLLVLLGVGKSDTEKDVQFVLNKVLNLRIFEDSEDKMNLSLLDIQGELLVVSQFTLYGDVRKGRRPSFEQAATPAEAQRIYEYFVAEAKKSNLTVATGVFQTHMEVTLTNDGPVTILIDSQKNF